MANTNLRAAHVILVTALVTAGVVGCKKAPEVELDSPELTAKSLGKLICAEHQLRMEEIADTFDQARALQTAKAELLADTAAIAESNSRLEKLAFLFDDHGDELESCEVVLVDRSTLQAETRERVALKVRYHDWGVDKDGDLEVVPRELPVVVTVVKLDDDWKIVDSSYDFSLPRGALGSLLD